MRNILFITTKISQKIRSITLMFPLKLILRLSILLFVTIAVITAVLVFFPDKPSLASQQGVETSVSDQVFNPATADNKSNLIVSKTSPLSHASPQETYLLRSINLPVRLEFPLDKTPPAFQLSLKPTSVPATPSSLKAEKASVNPRRNRAPDFMMKKKNHLYHPIILKAALRHEIDPALVKAIIMAESGYNPRAVSRSGAKGLMQLMPGTAKSLGVENIFDPEHNINGGVRYFKGLVNRFNGDLKLALAAYNAGTRKVREYKGVPPFKSTRFYIQKVFIYYEYFKDQMTGDMKRA